LAAVVSLLGDVVPPACAKDAVAKSESTNRTARARVFLWNIIRNLLQS
jgi:hypothetical protein